MSEESRDFTEIRLYMKYYRDSEVNKYAHMKYRDSYHRYFYTGFFIGLVIATTIAILVR